MRCAHSWRPRANQIERSTERTAGIAASITAQRAADGLDIGAELQRDAAGDRCVSCCRVGAGVVFMIRQEQFTDSAVAEPADRRGVFQAGNFNVERLGCPPVGEALALAHCPGLAADRASPKACLQRLDLAGRFSTEIEFMDRGPFLTFRGRLAASEATRNGA